MECFSEDSFEKKYGKPLKFSQLYDFFKSHKEYCYNKDIPHTSCLCEICENCVLLAKGLNGRLVEPLPTNPHDLVETFCCNSDEPNCIHDMCPLCCVDNAVNALLLNLSSSESDDSNNDSQSSGVTYFAWQSVEKRITKSKLTVSFEDAIVFFKNQVKTLKEHIYIKRVQSNAYRDIKSSLTTEDLVVHVDFAESYRNDQQDAIQSAYFGNQSFSIFTKFGLSSPTLSKFL